MGENTNITWVPPEQPTWGPRNEPLQTEGYVRTSIDPAWIAAGNPRWNAIKASPEWANMDPLKREEVFRDYLGGVVNKLRLQRLHNLMVGEEDPVLLDQHRRALSVLDQWSQHEAGKLYDGAPVSLGGKVFEAARGLTESAVRVGVSDAFRGTALLSNWMQEMVGLLDEDALPEERFLYRFGEGLDRIIGSTFDAIGANLSGNKARYEAEQRALRDSFLWNVLPQGFGSLLGFFGAGGAYRKGALGAGRWASSKWGKTLEDALSLSKKIEQTADPTMKAALVKELEEVQQSRLLWGRAGDAGKSRLMDAAIIGNLGGASEASSMYAEARSALPDDPDAALQAAKIGYVAGWLEAAPFEMWLSRLNKLSRGGVTRGFLRSVLNKETLGETIAESMQEVAQQGMENYAARMWDEDRPIREGMGTAGSAAAVSAGTFSAFIGVLGGRRARAVQRRVAKGQAPSLEEIDSEIVQNMREADTGHTAEPIDPNRGLSIAQIERASDVELMAEMNRMGIDRPSVAQTKDLRRILLGIRTGWMRNMRARVTDEEARLNRELKQIKDPHSTEALVLRQRLEKLARYNVNFMEQMARDTVLMKNFQSDNVFTDLPSWNKMSVEQRELFQLGEGVVKLTHAEFLAGLRPVADLSYLTMADPQAKGMIGFFDGRETGPLAGVTIQTMPVTQRQIPKSRFKTEIPYDLDFLVQNGAATVVKDKDGREWVYLRELGENFIDPSTGKGVVRVTQDATRYDVVEEMTELALKRMRLDVEAQGEQSPYWNLIQQIDAWKQLAQERLVEAGKTIPFKDDELFSKSLRYAADEATRGSKGDLAAFELLKTVQMPQELIDAFVNTALNRNEGDMKSRPEGGPLTLQEVLFGRAGVTSAAIRAEMEKATRDNTWKPQPTQPVQPVESVQVSTSPTPKSDVPVAAPTPASAEMVVPAVEPKGYESPGAGWFDAGPISSDPADLAEALRMVPPGWILKEHKGRLWMREGTLDAGAQGKVKLEELEAMAEEEARVEPDAQLEEPAAVTFPMAPRGSPVPGAFVTGMEEGLHEALAKVLGTRLVARLPGSVRAMLGNNPTILAHVSELLHPISQRAPRPDTKRIRGRKGPIPAGIAFPAASSAPSDGPGRGTRWAEGWRWYNAMSPEERAAAYGMMQAQVQDKATSEGDRRLALGWLAASEQARQELRAAIQTGMDQLEITEQLKRSSEDAGQVSYSISLRTLVADLLAAEPDAEMLLKDVTRTLEHVQMMNRLEDAIDRERQAYYVGIAVEKELPYQLVFDEFSSEQRHLENIKQLEVALRSLKSKFTSKNFPIDRKRRVKGQRIVWNRQTESDLRELLNRHEDIQGRYFQSVSDFTDVGSMVLSLRTKADLDLLADMVFEIENYVRSLAGDEEGVREAIEDYEVEVFIQNIDLVERLVPGWKPEQGPWPVTDLLEARRAQRAASRAAYTAQKTRELQQVEREQFGTGAKGEEVQRQLGLTPEESYYEQLVQEWNQQRLSILRERKGRDRQEALLAHDLKHPNIIHDRPVFRWFRGQREAAPWELDFISAASDANTLHRAVKMLDLSSASDITNPENFRWVDLSEQKTVNEVGPVVLPGRRLHQLMYRASPLPVFLLTEKTSERQVYYLRAGRQARVLELQDSAQRDVRPEEGGPVQILHNLLIPVVLKPGRTGKLSEWAEQHQGFPALYFDLAQSYTRWGRREKPAEVLRELSAAEPGGREKEIRSVVQPDGKAHYYDTGRDTDQGEPILKEIKFSTRYFPLVDFKLVTRRVREVVDRNGRFVPAPVSERVDYPVQHYFVDPDRARYSSKAEDFWGRQNELRQHATRFYTRELALQMEARKLRDEKAPEAERQPRLEVNTEGLPIVETPGVAQSAAPAIDQRGSVVTEIDGVDQLARSMLGKSDRSAGAPDIVPRGTLERFGSPRSLVLHGLAELERPPLVVRHGKEVALKVDMKATPGNEQRLEHIFRSQLAHVEDPDVVSFLRDLNEKGGVSYILRHDIGDIAEAQGWGGLGAASPALRALAVAFNDVWSEYGAALTSSPSGGDLAPSLEGVRVGFGDRKATLDALSGRIEALRASEDRQLLVVDAGLADGKDRILVSGVVEPARPVFHGWSVHPSYQVIEYGPAEVFSLRKGRDGVLVNVLSGLVRLNDKGVIDALTAGVEPGKVQTVQLPGGQVVELRKISYESDLVEPSESTVDNELLRTLTAVEASDALAVVMGDVYDPVLDRAIQQAQGRRIVGDRDFMPASDLADANDLPDTGIYERDVNEIRDWLRAARDQLEGLQDRFNQGVSSLTEARRQRARAAAAMWNGMSVKGKIIDLQDATREVGALEAEIEAMFKEFEQEALEREMGNVGEALSTAAADAGQEDLLQRLRVVRLHGEEMDLALLVNALRDFIGSTKTHQEWIDRAKAAIDAALVNIENESVWSDQLRRQVEGQLQAAGLGASVFGKPVLVVRSEKDLLRLKGFLASHSNTALLVNKQIPGLVEKTRAFLDDPQNRAARDELGQQLHVTGEIKGDAPTLDGVWLLQNLIGFRPLSPREYDRFRQLVKEHRDRFYGGREKLTAAEWNELRQRALDYVNREWNEQKPIGYSISLRPVHSWGLPLDSSNFLFTSVLLGKTGFAAADSMNEWLLGVRRSKAAELVSLRYRWRRRGLTDTDLEDVGAWVNGEAFQGQFLRLDAQGRFDPKQEDPVQVDENTPGTGNILKARWETRKELQQRMTPDHLLAAKEVREVLDKFYAEANEILADVDPGSVMAYFDDYLTNVYTEASVTKLKADPSYAEWRASIEREVTEGNARARHRVFSSMHEAATRAGLVPKTFNAYKLMTHYTTSVFRLATERAVVRMLLNTSAGDSNAPDAQLAYLVEEDKNGYAQPPAVSATLERATGTEFARSINSLLSRLPWVGRLFPATWQKGYALMSNIRGARGNRLWVHPKVVPVLQQIFHQPADLGVLLGAMEKLGYLAKGLNMALTGFHFITIGESVMGPAGFWKSMTSYRDVNGKWKPWWTYWHEALMRDDRLLHEMLEAGVQLFEGFEEIPSTTQQLVEEFREWAKRTVPVIGKTMEGISAISALHDRALWQVYVPAGKAMLYVQLMNGLRQDPAFDGVSSDVLRKQVAKMVNRATSGPDFKKIYWMHPALQRLLKQVFLSLPYTLGNIMILPYEARLKLPGMKKGLSLQDVFDVIRHHTPDEDELVNRQIQAALKIKFWKGFAPRVLFLWPYMMQFMAWSISRMFGLEPPEDREAKNPRFHIQPFPFMNEWGHGGYVDLTPFGRMWDKLWLPLAKSPHALLSNTGNFLMIGDPERPDLRLYTRFGKQIRELKDWVTDFGGTWLSKGGYWNRVIVQYVKRFSDIGNPYEHPMVDDSTITGVLGPPLKELMPFAGRGNAILLTAPVSRGTTEFKASRRMRALLEAYAEPSVAQKLFAGLQGLSLKERLDREVNEIMASAVANGEDPEKILSSAKGYVRTQYYEQLQHALWQQDHHGDFNKKAAEEALQRLFRLNVQLRDVYRSMNERGLKLEPEDMARLNELWNLAWKESGIQKQEDFGAWAFQQWDTRKETR